MQDLWLDPTNVSRTGAGRHGNIFSFRSREKDVLDFSSYRSGCYANHASGATIERLRVHDVAHFVKLTIAVVAVSMSVAAQTRQHHGNVNLCVPEWKYKNPFQNTALIGQQSIPLQAGIDFTKMHPPLEFRHNRLIEARAVGPRTSFWPPEPPLSAIEGCDVTHTDVPRSIH